MFTSGAVKTKDDAARTRRTAFKQARSTFVRAKKVEVQYARMLRRIARHVGDIVSGFPATHAERMVEALKRYATVIEPWAKAVGARMVAEVAAQDRKSWQRLTSQMGVQLKQEIASAPTGPVMRELLQRQVELITSLPLAAAQRVHVLATESLHTGTRAAELAQKILETGDVTQSRATLIARTETSRAATVLTQTRAQHIGSEYFVWRTVGDSDVRPTHKALNGRTFRWDDPPECDPGHFALPGSIWNCRCYPEPVIPEDDE